MQPQLPEQPAPRPALVIAAFAAIYLIWGSTYISVLIAIRHLPPMILGGIRFTTAGLILLVFALIKGERIPSVKDTGHISLAGALMLFIGTGTVAWVEQYIRSGLAAIIVAAVPIWFVILDRREWKANFSNFWVLLGLGIGFAGVLTLFADKDALDFAGDRMKVISVFALIFGSICWAAGSLYSKYAQVNASTIMKSAVQMLAAGILSFAAAWVTGEHHRLHLATVSQASWLAVLYLIFIGSLVGYIAYLWLLSVKPPALVGTYAYVNPVVAVFLGWVIAGEVITAQQGVALLIILSGVVLVTVGKNKRP